jgi:hypothetical protein
MVICLNHCPRQRSSIWRESNPGQVFRRGAAANRVSGSQVIDIEKGFGIGGIEGRCIYVLLQNT